MKSSNIFWLSLVDPESKVYGRFAWQVNWKFRRDAEQLPYAPYSGFPKGNALCLLGAMYNRSGEGDAKAFRAASASLSDNNGFAHDVSRQPL
jgi:hypothetical protein